jgi:hypothetical protein
MMRLALLALLLSACVTPPEVPPTEPATVTDWPAEPASTPPAVNHGPAATAVSEYRKAEKAEAHALTKPEATAETINAITRADKLARAAAADLVAQNGQPTAAAIARARRTLDDLIRALEAPR